MKKFYIETYGCQMNVSDSELIVSILTEQGFVEAENIDDADIILFNTCSVREKAEERVLGRISNEMSRKQSKNVKIGVLGCMAQRLGNELHKINKQIDYVIGVDQYHKLPEILGAKGFVSSTAEDYSQVYDNYYPTRKGINNAFVTIMRGCNNFCTYCIVPYTRGRERSRNIDEILTEIENAGKKGFKDVTLLGQNVNSYNYNNISFPELMQKAAQIESIERLRFVTSHPKDLSDELIEVMATNSKICKNVHLPLQSGSNEVLKAMNRGYTIEHYLAIVEKMRKAMPEIGLSTDIIAGFPGETEEQFLQTLEVVKKVRYDTAFMFHYSPRRGTKAAEFENQIDKKIRLERLQRLIDVQTEITTEKYIEQIGKTKTVYVEQVSKRNEKEVAGRTDDFKICVFEGDKSLIGKFVKVIVTEAKGWTLKGKML